MTKTTATLLTLMFALPAAASEPYVRIDHFDMQIGRLKAWGEVCGKGSDEANRQIQAIVQNNQLDLSPGTGFALKVQNYYAAEKSRVEREPLRSCDPWLTKVDPRRHAIAMFVTNEVAISLCPELKTEREVENTTLVQDHHLDFSPDSEDTRVLEHKRSAVAKFGWKPHTVCAYRTEERPVPTYDGVQLWQMREKVKKMTTW